jgi:hypothetical protein
MKKKIFYLFIKWKSMIFFVWNMPYPFPKALLRINTILIVRSREIKHLCGFPALNYCTYSTYEYVYVCIDPAPYSHLDSFFYSFLKKTILRSTSLDPAEILELQNPTGIQQYFRVCMWLGWWCVHDAAQIISLADVMMGQFLLPEQHSCLPVPRAETISYNHAKMLPVTFLRCYVSSTGFGSVERVKVNRIRSSCSSWHKVGSGSARKNVPDPCTLMVVTYAGSKYTPIYQSCIGKPS